ncbi:MAG: RES family NAD+ phosphorylase [Rhizomicrobium sp.]
MNLAAVSLLGVAAETRPWYRAVDSQFLTTALSTSHTRVVPSRFFDPLSASPQFPSLYLSDDPMVAMFEAQILFGSPLKPGGVVPKPKGTWIVLTAHVNLQRIVDLSDVAAQAHLDVSAQELTGDWHGYRQRSAATQVSAPVGTAPTQLLGEALHRDGRLLEGFLTVSARLSHHRNLIVFPQHLSTGSTVEYRWNNDRNKFVVDSGDPDGRSLGP